MIARPFVLLTCCVFCLSAAQPTAAISVETLLETGQALYAEARYAEAEDVFRKAVDLHPKSATAHYWLGMTYYAQEQDKEALKQFKRAVKLDKKLAAAYIGAGRVYLRAEQRNAARETFRKAADIEPVNADIPYYIGLTYIRARANIREHGVDGRRYFARAIELNPKHPDAYHQIGLTYEEPPARNPQKAIPYYFQQLLVAPEHADALDHLARCLLQTGQFEYGVDLIKRIAALPGAARNPRLAVVQPQLQAVALHAQRRYGAAFDMYEAYLDALDPAERRHYMDLSHVAPEDVAAQYHQAPPEEQAEMFRKFWASRDPDPSTVVNERLVEHYRRVMTARMNFSRAQSPWDRRGEIYVRYGEPDDRQRLKVFSGLEADIMIDHQSLPPGTPGTPGTRFSPQNWRVDYETTQNGRVDAIRELQHRRYTPPMVSGAAVIESWVYNRYDLELMFMDPWKTDTFDYPPMVDVNPRTLDFHPKKLVARLIARTPEGYQHDYGGAPLEFMFDAVTYRGEDGHTEVEFAYTVPARQLGFVGDGQGGPETWFESHLVLRDMDWRRKAAAEARIGPIERPRFKVPKSRAGTELRTASISLEAPAGAYRSAIAVRDALSRRIGIYEATLNVWDYTGQALNLSDIKLAASVTPAQNTGRFVRHGLEIVPHPTHRYEQTQPVYFYYEIYNLTKDETGRTSYRTDLEITAQEKEMNIFWRILSGFGRLVNKPDEPQTVILSFEGEGVMTDEYKFTSLDPGESPPADYTLKVTITDLHTGQTISKSTAFTVGDDGKRSAVEDDEPKSIDMRIKKKDEG